MSKNNKTPSHTSGQAAFHSDLSVKPMKVEEKNKVKASTSENSIKKGKNLKPSLSTKSWNSQKPYRGQTNDINVNTETISYLVNSTQVDAHLADFHNSNLPHEVEEFECTSNLLRARDSLENLLKADRTFLEDVDSSKLASTSTISTPETTSPRSLPALNESSKSTVASKSVAWESHEKANKNRKTKENKKKKGNKVTELANNLKDLDTKDKGRDFTSGDEKKVPASQGSDSILESFSYSYHRPKHTRSVVFTNEVMVVYFNGENVLCEVKEPLKKELEQQLRNKVMRRGHLILN